MSMPLRRPWVLRSLLCVICAGLAACGAPPARSLPPPEYETPELPPFAANGEGGQEAAGSESVESESAPPEVAPPEVAAPEGPIPEATAPPEGQSPAPAPGGDGVPKPGAAPAAPVP